MQNGRDFRILDKDLDRLGHAEGAGRAAARPLRRLGLIMGLGLYGLRRWAVSRRKPRSVPPPPPAME